MSSPLCLRERPRVAFNDSDEGIENVIGGDVVRVLSEIW
jgi:hypothetical protein